MTPKELEALVGTEVAIMPQGNSIRSNMPLSAQITLVTLLSSRGTRVVVSGIAQSFEHDGTLDRQNYGYKLYPTKQQAINTTKGNPFNTFSYFDVGKMSIEDYDMLCALAYKYK